MRLLRVKAGMYERDTSSFAAVTPSVECDPSQRMVWHAPPSTQHQAHRSLASTGYHRDLSGVSNMYHAASVSSDSASSSSCKGEEMDAKKRAKREANRRSAQLSRARKKAFIEDLKQKNHEYQRCEQILACHPDMVFAFDAAGTIEFANARACSQLDLSARDLEAQSFFEMLVAESRLRFQSALQQVMSRPGQQTHASLRFDAPLEMIAKEDKPLRLEVHAQCTRDENEVGQWLVVCAARPLYPATHHQREDAPPWLLETSRVDGPSSPAAMAARNVFPMSKDESPNSKNHPHHHHHHRNGLGLEGDDGDRRAPAPSVDPLDKPLNVFALVAAAADLEPVDCGDSPSKRKHLSSGSHSGVGGPRVGALAAAAEAQNKKRARATEPSSEKLNRSRGSHTSTLNSLSMAALSASMAYDG